MYLVRYGSFDLNCMEKRKELKRVFFKIKKVRGRIETKLKVGVFLGN